MLSLKFAHIQEEERITKAEQQSRDHQTRNPMEPLLMKLATEFSDSQDLSDRLGRLYQVRW